MLTVEVDCIQKEWFLLKKGRDEEWDWTLRDSETSRISLMHGLILVFSEDRSS